MLVTGDTDILIWGVRASSSLGDELMIPRAKRFLQWLHESGHVFTLTAVAVTEYLIGAEKAQRETEFAILSSKYVIYPYDTLAIAIAADIRSDKDFIRSLGDDFGKTRVTVKSDVYIVATAMAAKVDKIYSNDNGLRALATRSGLSASPIPTIEEMDPLPAAAPSHPSSPSRGRSSLFEGIEPPPRDEHPTIDG